MQILRRWCLLLLILPLAACFDPGAVGEGLGFRSPPEAAPKAGAEAEKQSPLKQAALFDGRIMLQAPEGYCIDAQSLRSGGRGAFALIASCANLSGAPSEAVPPAVITLTALPRRLLAQAPKVEDLAESAAPAKVLMSDQQPGFSLVQLSEGGDAALPGGDPRYWRAGMLVNGHIVGLALYGPEGSEITGESGKKLLVGVASSLVAENADDKRASIAQNSSN